MTKIFLSLWVFLAAGLISILSPTSAFAALDSSLKECVQRGYNFAIRDGVQYCVFPDGSECLIDEFNQNQCGDQFKTKTYCVTQGHYVWDNYMCCRNLKYTENNGLAQATCEFDYPKEILAKVGLLVSQLFIGGIIFLKISRESPASR